MSKDADSAPERINGQWVNKYANGNVTNSSTAVETGFSSKFKMINNYIYLYHTGKLISIPAYPESIADTNQVQYTPTTIIGRSAPIYSYQSSGPRTLQIDLKLHRDMIFDIVYMTPDSIYHEIKEGENSLTNMDADYVDTIVREIQAAAVPKYAASEKMIDPPMAAVRFGNEVYIRGVINGNVGVTYGGAILANEKYSQVDISFSIAEVDPFDAEEIMEYGSLRGINTTLERNVWTTTGTTNATPGSLSSAFNKVAI